MKHYFKKLIIFLYICLALIAYSCSEERDITKEQNRISTVNLKDLPFLQKELTKGKGKGFYSKEDTMYYLDKINTENIIQIIDQLGIKSYTFGLNYRKQDTLFNLCAKETNEGYSYTLLKYSTTNLDEWIQDIKTTQKSFINPDIKAEPLDSKVYLSQTTCIEFHFLCPSGEHDLSNSSGCVFPREQWYSAFEIVTCNSNSGGGPGDPIPIVSSTGNGPNNSGTTTTTAPNVSDIEGPGTNETPCDKLKDKLDPTRANFKPAIVDLQATLDQQGENLTSFKKNSANMYSNPATINATTTNSINGPLGPNYYGEAHTHAYQGPNAAYPMFSWTDVNRLLDLQQSTGSWNQNDVINIGVFKDDLHVNQVYAITINDIAAFTTLINQLIDSIPIPIVFSKKERFKYLDNELGNKYANDNNYERAFLEFFANYNISFFRANANLTTWEELKLNSPTSPTIPSTVQSIPCNN